MVALPACYSGPAEPSPPMTTAPACPFCQAPLPRLARHCPACGAEPARSAMSPRGFRWYAALWLACSAVVLALALAVAADPWRARGSPPAYALALVGEVPLPAPAADCRTELVDAQGRRSVVVQPGPCGAPAAGRPAPAPAPDPTRLRMAAALHGLLVLAGAAALCLLLRALLRRPFLRPVGGGWVRRGG